MRPGFRIAYYVAVTVVSVALSLALLNGEKSKKFDPVALLPAIVACTDYYGTLLVAGLVKNRFPNADLARLELNPLWKGDIANLRILSVGFGITVFLRIVMFLMLSQAPPGGWIGIYLGSVGLFIGFNGAATIHHGINIILLHQRGDLSARFKQKIVKDTSKVADCVAVTLFAVASLFAPLAFIVGGFIGVIVGRLMRIRLVKEAALGMY